ncbi:Wzz/FepE/Etk N-terminal domain-containing protein [Roseateles sp. NT4]|uniref:Wzz/FepE/Etk N-terminal domain-containing protein n=1 Tax=Roseateles sp. NT4 TaxID=3453715 RepID=UPI003EEA9714
MTTHEAQTESTPLLRILTPHWRQIAVATLAAGVLGAAGSFLIPPTYTARMSFLSPQPQQGGLAAAALASLGALSGLAGAMTGGGVKSPADQYVALLNSANLSDKIIDKFGLVEVYDVKYKMDARKRLEENTRFGVGKKDNIIAVEVDDHDPQRAADMANTYLQELRKLNDTLTIGEAKQRRVFFEQQLKQTQVNLGNAQLTLQKSGFNPGALKSEPKSAAEIYAKLQGVTAAAEVKLEALRRSMNDSAAEVQQQMGVVAGLHSQLAKQERPASSQSDQDYIAAYREYKYHEALFDIFARQFELAKVDEAREGNLFQVIDVATAPERKSKPKRLYIAAGVAYAGFMLACYWFWRKHHKQSAAR